MWRSKTIDTVENGNVQNQVDPGVIDGREFLLRGVGNGIDQHLTQGRVVLFGRWGRGCKGATHGGSGSI